MIKNKIRIISIVGFFISIILIRFFHIVIVKLTYFIETYVSQGHKVDMGIIYAIENYLSFIIFIILIISIIYMVNLNRKIFQFSSTYIDWNKAKSFFLTDDICNKKKLPTYLFFINTTISLFVSSLYLNFGKAWIKQEGILENFTEFLFLISALIAIISIIKVNKKQFPLPLKKNITITLTIISILFFYIFGEEISWGQHIFKWESFGIFSNYNWQQETNIHNFFNPYLFVIYPLIGVGLFLSLFFIWFFSKRKTYFHQLFIPHQSLFFIVFAMAYTSFIFYNETYELLFSIFSFSYIIRIFICLNHPKLN